GGRAGRVEPHGRPLGRPGQGADRGGRREPSRGRRAGEGGSVKKAPRLRHTTARTRVVVGALIGMVVGGAVVGLRHTRPFVGAEWRLVDARTNEYLGQRGADPGIVMAEVRNEDVAALRDDGYDWPWPLDVRSYAFRWLDACRARAVVVDVFHFDRGIGPEEKAKAPPKGGPEVEGPAAGAA